MDIFVSDYEKQYKEILTGFDPTTFSETWVENQQWQLDFYVEKTRNNQDVFDLLNHESSVYLDGQEFVVKQLKRGAVGKIVYSEVTATHIYFTMQDDYQYNIISGSKSAKDCLAHIFAADEQGFSFELIDKNKVLENITQENFGNGNLLKLVQEVLEDYKLVMLADNKRLTFIPSEDYGEHTENEIRYNKHTNEVDFDIDTLSLKTQIRGYGKVDSNGNN
ncbi:phage tail protein, partial [Listeria monocytogenes]|nr:phage tail protein [Listeria monocytogenes]